MLTRRAVTVPVVAAVVLNASPRPWRFESMFGWFAAVPSRTARPVGGGGGGGVAVTVPAAKAESAPSVNVAPVVHVAGSAASALTELVSELPAPTPARSRKRRVPPLPRSAIHSVWPAVTFTAGTLMVLNWPATGAASVPVVRRVTGWFAALFGDRGAVSDPGEPGGAKTRSCATRPVGAGGVLDGSATPAGFPG